MSCSHLINVLVWRRFAFRGDVLLAADGADATAPRSVVHLEDGRVHQLLGVAERDARNVERADEVDPSTHVRLLVDPADHRAQLAAENERQHLAATCCFLDPLPAQVFLIYHSLHLNYVHS